MVEVMKIMVTSFKRSVLALLHSVPLTLHQAIANMASTGDSWTLMGMCESVSCWVIAPCFWVLVHTRFCLCPPTVCFLVLFKFWHLCGGVNGDLLQDGLCHTQVYCTQSPCSSPLLTRTSPETLKHSEVFTTL